MAGTGFRRFGPGRVWLGLMALDLVVSLAVARTAVELSRAADDPGPALAPPEVAVFVILLLGSLCGTWWAVAGRRHHATTVRAGIAVSAIRLVVLGLPFAFHVLIERGCGC
jgi:hypothetical protein